MANYLNRELSQIIRDISYGNGKANKLHGLIKRLKNEQARIEDRLRQLPLEIAEAEFALQQHKVEFGKLGDKARCKYPKLPVEDIRPTVPTPKRGDWKWGDFKRELIFVLKATNGVPVSTRHLIDHCVIRFGLPTSSPEEKQFLREAVGKPLRKLGKEGIVERIPNPNPSAVAYWVWIGMD